MGIRVDQIIGLNSWALEFTAPKPSSDLHYMEKVLRVYPDGKVDDGTWTHVFYNSVDVEQYSEFNGMFDNTYPLMKYMFRDGKVLYEEVQASPWSSGPVIFLCLKDDKGQILPESKWPDDEMQRYL